MKHYKKNEIYYFRLCEDVKTNKMCYVRVRYKGKSSIEGQGYFWPVDSNWPLGACPDWSIKKKSELTENDEIIALQV